ncbi:MAG: N-6 DNA methylase [Anaerolineae bacterium]|nr:N-6 DNA methylase [Anaerolineae bacterium]
MVSDEQRIAQESIKALIDKYNGLNDETRDNMTEASVVTQFIEPLLEALGWPTREPGRYVKELHTGAGRPDLTLIPEEGGTIFVEAKRFGVIKELKEARKTVSGIVTPGQLTLPGMAADRTPQEQQAINYAFENNGTWAILTNFEKLRLFNARRDWLVLSFETPAAYLSQFDYLWQLSYECILNGELDRLSSQRHREDVDADYLSFINEYRQLLAQSIIARHGANRWAFIEESDRVDLPKLRDVVQRFLDRLVVARFAEDHFVLKPGTLRNLIESNRNSDYGFSLNIVMRQFFRRFDEQHNSALFAYDQIIDHEADFDEDLILRLVDKLYEARYRAMPPDIMGNTYEQYLGTALVQVNGEIGTRSNLETRKKQGSYYTPQVIVRYLVDHSLGRYLYGTANGKPDGEKIKGEQRKRYDEIEKLRVLDPACGSGSFLIYAYEVLAEFYRAEIARIRQEADAYGQERAAEGISLLEIEGVINAYTGEHLPYLQSYPHLILERHLYGVDLDPQAAELAAVNLIFRAMEDMRRMGSDKKLPLILNQNIKCGNALIGTLDRLPEGVDGGEIAGALADLRRLRERLARNSHDEAVIKQIAETEAGVNAKLNAHLDGHFEDVDARRPLNWAAAFPECFVDENGQWLGDGAGFDVIVGNPPWEIVKPSLRDFFFYRFDETFWKEHSRRDADGIIAETFSQEPVLRKDWESLNTAYSETISYYDTSGEYTEQGGSDKNTYKLFLERCHSLLRNGGLSGLVIPSGIYSDLGTQPLRNLLYEQSEILYLLSFANNKRIFADIHPSFKFVLLGFRKGSPTDSFSVLFRVTVEDAVDVDSFGEVANGRNNLILLTMDQLRFFSPHYNVVLELKSQRDIDILTKVFNVGPLLGFNEPGSWQFVLNSEFHMTSDRKLFTEKVVGWPVYEGRMIDQFDHRVAYWVSGHGRSATWNYSASPERFLPQYSWRAQYYIDPIDAIEKQEAKYGRRCWRIGICDVTAPTNRRTTIAAMLPMDAGIGNTINTAVVDIDHDYKSELNDQELNTLESRTAIYCVSILNSMIFDYSIRFRTKLHLNQFVLNENPMPRLTPGDPYFDALVPRAARLTCTTPAFADLWQEVMGEPWDETKGATDPAERQRLRDEIDALVAHLYGLGRDDFEHILGTFPLVFPNDGEGHAKKEALLSVYDEIEEVGLSAFG